MKVGDRVIYKNHLDIILHNEKATVIHIVGKNIQIKFESESSRRCDFNDKYTHRKLLKRILGGEMTFWAEPENLTLDTEWYREEKLKEIGILCEAEIPQKSGII